MNASFPHWPATRGRFLFLCSSALLVLTALGSGCGDDASPALPEGDWVQLAAGEYHSCGRQTTGRVECWGKTTFLKVPSDVAFEAIDAYGDELCAIDDQGGARCYGGDIEGAGTADAYQQISVGNFYACGLSQAGQIDCWGVERQGETDAPADGPYVEIDTGSSHGCALREDGSIDCWGLGSDPEVDESQQYAPDYDQAVPPTGAGFTDLGLAKDASCAIDADGAVQCWGEADSPVTEVHAGRYAELDGSANNMCGITLDGRVYCWGITDQLVDEAPGDAGYAGLAVGANHACALRVATNEVVCWGVGSDPNGDDTPESGIGQEDYDQAVAP